MVLNLMSEIGHMCDDKGYLASATAKVTEDELDTFFVSCVNEITYGAQIKKVSSAPLVQAIAGYFDHVTSEKDKLIAEKKAEGAMEIVAGAAMVGAAAMAWCPGVNFALDAVSLAALATQLALQFEEAKLQGTLTEDIMNADTKILTDENFKDVKPYQDTLQSNIKFYPRLQLAATVMQVRSLFLSTILYIKKKKKGACAAADMRVEFVNWYNWYSKADPALVMEFTQILQDLLDQQDPAGYQTALNGFLDKIKGDPNFMIAKKAIVGMGLMFAAGGVLKYGTKALVSAYRNWCKTVEEQKLLGDEELEDLNEAGDSVAEGGEAAETSLMSRAGLFLRAIQALAGVALIVIGALDIKQAEELDTTLTKQISDSKDNLTTYYTDLVQNAIG